MLKKNHAEDNKDNYKEDDSKSDVSKQMKKGGQTPLKVPVMPSTSGNEQNKPKDCNVDDTIKSLKHNQQRNPKLCMILK